MCFVKKTSLLGQHSSFPFPPLMGFLAAAFNWVLFWLLLLWHGPSPFLFEFTGRQATKKHWSVFKVVPTCHRVTPCDTAKHWAPEHWKKNPAKKIWSNEGYQAYTWNQMLGHHVCTFHGSLNTLQLKATNKLPHKNWHQYPRVYIYMSDLVVAILTFYLFSKATPKGNK